MIVNKVFMFLLYFSMNILLIGQFILQLDYIDICFVVWFRILCYIVLQICLVIMCNVELQIECFVEKVVKFLVQDVFLFSVMVKCCIIGKVVWDVVVGDFKKKFIVVQIFSSNLVFVEFLLFNIFI